MDPLPRPSTDLKFPHDTLRQITEKSAPGRKDDLWHGMQALLRLGLICSACLGTLFNICIHELNPM